MKFSESGFLILSASTPKGIYDELAKVEDPYDIISVYAASPSRHYVAIKRKEVKEIDKTKLKK